MEIGEKYDLCAAALKDYADAAGFTDVVIGLSGGIDSSVVATMCVDVFGAEHVHGFKLPGPYSTSHSIDDSDEMAHVLGISTDTISIVEPYEAFERALRTSCGGALKGLASENTQARCRMVCLMALSNEYNWMLVNTGNKSEAMAGFSTLYGDTAGAFAPLGGLYKGDVYAVGRYANDLFDSRGMGRPIPEHVFTKAPSAELSPGQEDETSMGIDYESMDAILIEAIEHGKSPEEIAAEGFSIEQVNQVLDRARFYEFKRAMEPPYPQAKFY